MLGEITANLIQEFDKIVANGEPFVRMSVTQFNSSRKEAEWNFSRPNGIR